MPNSRAVASPSWRIFSQSSERTFSTISSMRAGWIRPSTMSFSRAWRATSRRRGSNAEMTIASGVSSMMRSTPVAASRARMLRPSRPMMRPFRSSEGSSTTRDRRLDHRVRRETLDRHADDPPRFLRGLLVGFLLDAADEAGGLEPGLVLDGFDEVALGVDRRQARDLLEPLALLLDDRLDLGALVLEALLLVAEGLFLAGVVLLAPLLLDELAVEVLLFLLDPLLEAGDLLPPGLDRLVELDPGREDLFLGLDVGFPDLRLGLLAGLGERTVGLRPDSQALLLDLLPGDEEADGGQDRGKDESRRGRNRETCAHSAPPKCPGDADGPGCGYTMGRK